MPTWKQTRLHLLSSLHRPQALRMYEALRAEHVAFVGFERPAAVVAFFSRPGDLDAKDAVYKALVEAAQAHAVYSPLAMQLLWLGLWPALSRQYRQQTRGRGDYAEALSQVADTFTQVVARLKPGRCHRFAATLVGNTRRQLGRVPRGAPARPLPAIELARVSRARAVEELALVHITLERLVRAHGARPCKPDSVRRQTARIRNRLAQEILFVRIRPRRARVMGMQTILCPNHRPSPYPPLATVRVGARRYCGRCASFLSGTPPPLEPEHLAGTACLVTEDVRPGAICPRCLVDLFRAGGAHTEVSR